MSPWLSPATLRNLSDKLYEKRKAAALEVEQARDCASSGRARLTLLAAQATKALAAAGDLISVVRESPTLCSRSARRAWCVHVPLLLTTADSCRAR